MKKTLLLFLVLAFQIVVSQVKILSWNIENLGKSKTTSTIIYIAKTVKDYDIVAIQEVVAGSGGAQAVARLADELNRMGNKWDYVVSDPTTSYPNKKERYAFLWKTKQIKKIGRAWLEEKYNVEIDREPFYCTFESSKRQFTLVNFHAITKKLQPETEIKYFKFLPSLYSELNLIFLGDFNCQQSHSVFSPLRKMGFTSALVKQKTSLKRECKANVCLASEYDNIFFDKGKIKAVDSGIISFYQDFSTLREARKVSDHVPIFMTFTVM